jgi:phosphatidylglycerophosphate synthase
VRAVHHWWGAANTITGIRAVLTLVLAVLVLRDVPPDVVVPIAAVALVTDAVDGRVARRTGTVTRFGARFDMETDAALLLVLSVYVARDLGLWVLAIGLARYVFGAAKAPLPWLRGQAPPRPWCKVVAALQGVALVVAASGLIPDTAATAILLVALALLTESFAHEAWDLWRLRTPHVARPWASRLTGLLAIAVVWAVLVAPDEIGALSPAAFARIPLEGLVLVALVLLLPARPAAWLATTAGVVVGVVALLKLLDLGISVAFARRFDPLGDPVYVGAGVSFLRDALGTANAYTVTVLALGLMVAVLVLVPYAVRHAAGLARGHRPVAVPVLAVLALVWGASAVTGVRVAPGEPVAATSAVDLASTHVTEVRERLRERAALAAAISDDKYADVPADQLLSALRGKDVLLVFVESYGQVALEGLPTSNQLRASVDADGRRLEAAGYAARSAYLTSPTFGAMSWLAHSTLQSGLWIDNQGTYDLLLDRDRMTLSSAFRKAGWRSVGMIPADTEPWPEGERFYRWEALHDATNMDYEGPRFGYGRMPDQFALEAFRRLELERADREPVMAEIDLESSHNPWVPLPRMLDPRELGDGSVFDGMEDEGPQRDETWRDADLVKAAYVRSLQYSLEALTAFLVQQAAQPANRDLVVVMLGDHWPVTTVSGTTPGHAVPISVIAHDPEVLDAIDAWGWDDGLRPHQGAPEWRMDAFRDRFLAAYSG